MASLIIPSFFLSLTGVFSLFGVKEEFAVSQIIFYVTGLAIFYIFRKIGRNYFAANSRLFYWCLIFLLVITFIIGYDVRGSRRWIDFYFFNFQSSEIFKGFFILFLSSFLAKDFRFQNPINIFVLSFFYFILPALIIFKQPDLGNASVYFFIYLMILLFSDLPKKYILFFCLTLFLIMPFGWKMMKDYQKARITSFLNPKIDVQGTAYNMHQAIITIGSGKFAGRGMGLGTQSKLFFLPENHTDFAFSSLVEQFGFLGGFTVIALYLIMVFHLIRALMKYFYLRETEDKKKFLYTVGFLSYFIYQIFINIGMNLGIFPVTGIALPFISYGGSSFVALFIGLALLP